MEGILNPLKPIENGVKLLMINLPPSAFALAFRHRRHRLKSQHLFHQGLGSHRHQRPLPLAANYDGGAWHSPFSAQVRNNREVGDSQVCDTTGLGRHSEHSCWFGAGASLHLGGTEYKPKVAARQESVIGGR